MLNLILFSIIVLFSIFLKEFITPLSFCLIALSSFRLFYRRIVLGQVVINVICLIIFGHYLFTYGKVITPEIGLNFLLNVILLKWMESKKYRDEVMCIFGTILLISSGSLFDKTLLYFSFFTISFFLLLHHFFKLNNAPFFTLKNTKVYLKLIALVFILFFIFPRIPNPIPFSFHSGNEGEIGYSPEINISSIERLLENDKRVFWAKLDNLRERRDLYWRGNVVSLTDGWNWLPGPVDQGLMKVSEETIDETEEYRLFIKTPYLFTYDHSPSLLKVNHKTYSTDQTYSFNTSFIKNYSRYFIKSLSETSFEKIEKKLYLEHSLEKESVQWIDKTFKAKNLDAIIEEYRDFITREKFTYSWSPGKIKSFDEFISKRIGFCTHYASSLALILRVKNYPARLVSGFQGGRYNPYGGFYEINQNDAHAWIEVYQNGNWMRVDPTSFIAPERIIMDYMEVVNNNFIVPTVDTHSKFSFFNEMNFILSQWDFEFYQLMDNWDSFTQLNFFSQFKLTKKKLFGLSLLIVFLFFYFLARNKRRMSYRQKRWIRFLRIIEKQGVIYKGSFGELNKDLTQSGWVHKEKSIILANEFMNLFYNDSGNDKSIDRLLDELSR